MEQLFGICRVSVAPMRSEPSDKAENATQLLFGEFVEVSERRENWWYVRNAYDSYEGWMDFRQLQVVNQEEYHRSGEHQFLVPANALNVVADPNGNLIFKSG
jgi:hypothetical protein